MGAAPVEVEHPPWIYTFPLHESKWASTPADRELLFTYALNFMRLNPPGSKARGGVGINLSPQQLMQQAAKSFTSAWVAERVVNRMLKTELRDPTAAERKAQAERKAEAAKLRDRARNAETVNCTGTYEQYLNRIEMFESKQIDCKVARQRLELLFARKAALKPGKALGKMVQKDFYTSFTAAEKKYERKLEDEAFEEASKPREGLGETYTEEMEDQE